LRCAAIAQAFRAGLAACSASGGGTLFVPSGLFVLRGNLTVPPGVTLRGTYSAPPSHDLGDDASNPQSLLDGSVLIPTGGRHGNGCAPGVDDLNCTAAFVTITQNAAVCGLVVWYQEQERVLTPVPYPWTFRLGGIYSNHYSNNAALTDVEILGAWNGVAAVQVLRLFTSLRTQSPCFEVPCCCFGVVWCGAVSAVLCDVFLRNAVAGDTLSSLSHPQAHFALARASPQADWLSRTHSLHF